MSQTASAKFQFINAINKNPPDRLKKDIEIIYSHLKLSGIFDKTLVDPSVQDVCKNAFYEKHGANDILYCRGEYNNCWYILLSGSVFIDGLKLSPNNSFGKRILGSNKRTNECVVLEDSELLLIKYEDNSKFSYPPHRSMNSSALPSDNFSFNSLGRRRCITRHSTSDSIKKNLNSTRDDILLNLRDLLTDETHSNNFLSDTRTDLSLDLNGFMSMNQSNRDLSELDCVDNYQSNSSFLHSFQTANKNNFDLVGQVLMDDKTYDEPFIENSNFSDVIKNTTQNDSVYNTFSPLKLALRNCLETHKTLRSAEELELISHCLLFPSLNYDTNYHESNFPPPDVMPIALALKRAYFRQIYPRIKHSQFDKMDIIKRDYQKFVESVCREAILAEVPNINTVVLNCGEQLDSWCLIFNGNIEIEYIDDQNVSQHLMLKPGDYFGVRPNLTYQYFKASMHTLTPLCSFICIGQNDYYKIIREFELVDRDDQEGDAYIENINNNINSIHNDDNFKAFCDSIDIDLFQNATVSPDTMDYDRFIGEIEDTDAHSFLDESWDDADVFSNNSENKHSQATNQFHHHQLSNYFGEDFDRSLSNASNDGGLAIPIDDDTLCHDKKSYQKEENTPLTSCKHINKGTVSELLDLLIVEQNAAGKNSSSYINNSSHTSYIENFLLTYRIFIRSPLVLTTRLEEWFVNFPEHREKASRILLLWVNNHFSDFEKIPKMMEFLENFESLLEKQKMHGQLTLLNMACFSKAKNRVVVLNRSLRDDILHFSILGGWERNSPIFISKVEKFSRAHEMGLKRGDQVLEVNGQNFEHISHTHALDIFRNSTHLSITVKSNILGFKQFLDTSASSGSPHRSIPITHTHTQQIFKVKPQSLSSDNSIVQKFSNNSLFNKTISSNSLGGPKFLLASMWKDKKCKFKRVLLNQTTSNNKANANIVLGNDTNNLVENRNTISVSHKVRRKSVASVSEDIVDCSSSSPSISSNSNHSSHHHLTHEANKITENLKKVLHLSSKNSSPKDSSNIFRYSLSSSHNSSCPDDYDCKKDQQSDILTLENCDSYKDRPKIFIKNSPQKNDELSRQSLSSNANSINLSTNSSYGIDASAYPEHVIKVYRSPKDQAYKFLLIHKETTAKEVIMLSLREFGVTDPSSHYSLFEVSVQNGGVLKRKRLPEQLNNLADRIGLNARYYIKKNFTSISAQSQPITSTINGHLNFSSSNAPYDQSVTNNEINAFKEDQQKNDCNSSDKALASELLTESGLTIKNAGTPQETIRVSLLTLKCFELAVQLTLRDFDSFRKIEAAEYINDLFGLNRRYLNDSSHSNKTNITKNAAQNSEITNKEMNHFSDCSSGRIDISNKPLFEDMDDDIIGTVGSFYSTENLNQFEKSIDKEMFWVINEVVSETKSLVKRYKKVKFFLKLAHHCKALNNFNSAFSICSGLCHSTVSRLEATWSRVPAKYKCMLEDLKSLMDPSRNMVNYRTSLKSVIHSPPIIPFFPLFKKDLTFIHLGNPTYLPPSSVNAEVLDRMTSETNLTDNDNNTINIDIEPIVNFDKMRMLSKEIAILVDMCSVPFDFRQALDTYGAHSLATNSSMTLNWSSFPPFSSFSTFTNSANCEESLKNTSNFHHNNSFFGDTFDNNGVLNSGELAGSKGGININKQFAGALSSLKRWKEGYGIKIASERKNHSSSSDVFSSIPPITSISSKMVRRKSRKDRTSASSLETLNFNSNNVNAYMETPKINDNESILDQEIKLNEFYTNSWRPALVQQPPPPNPRKMWENARRVRRTRAYLVSALDSHLDKESATSGMNGIIDESALARLSQQCEPSNNTNTALEESNVSTRSRARRLRSRNLSAGDGSNSGQPTSTDGTVGFLNKRERALKNVENRSAVGFNKLNPTGFLSHFAVTRMTPSILTNKNRQNKAGCTNNNSIQNMNPPTINRTSTMMPTNYKTTNKPKCQNYSPSKSRNHMFGSNSPQSMQKLLSLSQSTKYKTTTLKVNPPNPIPPNNHPPLSLYKRPITTHHGCINANHSYHNRSFSTDNGNNHFNNCNNYYAPKYNLVDSSNFNPTNSFIDLDNSNNLVVNFDAIKIKQSSVQPSYPTLRGNIKEDKTNDDTDVFKNGGEFVLRHDLDGLSNNLVDSETGTIGDDTESNLSRTSHLYSSHDSHSSSSRIFRSVDSGKGSSELSFYFNGTTNNPTNLSSKIHPKKCNLNICDATSNFRKNASYHHNRNLNSSQSFFSSQCATSSGFSMDDTANLKCLSHVFKNETEDEGSLNRRSYSPETASFSNHSPQNRPLSSPNNKSQLFDSYNDESDLLPNTLKRK